MSPLNVYATKQETIDHYQPLIDFKLLDWDSVKRTSRNRWCIQVTCPICEKQRWRVLSSIASENEYFTGYCVSCSNRFDKEKRRKASNTAGHKGRIKSKTGYINIYIPYLEKHEQEFLSSMIGSHPYIQEHRLVMARHLRRPLDRHEIVHHINGIKDDNRIENLKLLCRKAHTNTNGSIFFQELQEAKSEIQRLKLLLGAHNISY